MKRDLDVARQLLLDIENHGPDCSLSTLRAGLAHDAEERLRYHLSLLVDARLVKEIDRTSAGVPCVRLTNAGHELIELCRSDVRWREATCLVHEQTGGVSLSVVRAVLAQWAVEDASRYDHPRAARGYRPYYLRSGHLRRSDYLRYDRAARDGWADGDEPRLVRTHPEYRERFDARDMSGFDHDDVSLPIYLV